MTKQESKTKITSQEQSGHSPEHSEQTATEHKNILCIPISKIWMHKQKNIIVFCLVFATWLILDAITKHVFDAYTPGQAIARNILGIIDIVLVRNTGMAWGLLSNSTVLLAILSLVVCVVLTLYFFTNSSKLSVVQALGLGLVVAGGAGNAIDRFLQGYVIDFIEVTFIDFPVFNFADVGVTCGFILFAIGLLYGEYRASKKEVIKAEARNDQTSQENKTFSQNSKTPSQEGKTPSLNSKTQASIKTSQEKGQQKGEIR